jgi:hypothetical protein
MEPGVEEDRTKEFGLSNAGSYRQVLALCTPALL